MKVDVNICFESILILSAKNGLSKEKFNFNWKNLEKSGNVLKRKENKRNAYRTHLSQNYLYRPLECPSKYPYQKNYKVQSNIFVFFNK
jgi:hypothetical protein